MDSRAIKFNTQSELAADEIVIIAGMVMGKLRAKMFPFFKSSLWRKPVDALEKPKGLKTLIGVGSTLWVMSVSQSQGLQFTRDVPLTEDKKEKKNCSA